MRFDVFLVYKSYPLFHSHFIFVPNNSNEKLYILCSKYTLLCPAKENTKNIYEEILDRNHNVPETGLDYTYTT